MKKNIFYLVISLMILSFFGQGCGASTYMTSKRGTIKVGMTKTEVLAIWGEPELRHLFEEDTKTYERWELWRYPRMTWWAAHGVDIAFNKDGILTSIEPLYK